MYVEATSSTVAVAVLTTALTGLSYFAYRLVTHRRFYRDLVSRTATSIQ
ncbi:hypothetical protein IMZ48_40050 [Candidatus Bathyarchaeota archaeon]|nr:hypothetical protein [Candidatus Bathyarchaeota archaeon]